MLHQVATPVLVSEQTAMMCLSPKPNKLHPRMRLHREQTRIVAMSLQIAPLHVYMLRQVAAPALVLKQTMQLSRESSHPYPRMCLHRAQIRIVAMSLRTDHLRVYMLHQVAAPVFPLEQITRTKQPRPANMGRPKTCWQQRREWLARISRQTSLSQRPLQL